MGINENTSSRARLVYNYLLNAPEVLEDDATMRLCHTAEYSKVNPEVRQHPIIAILPRCLWDCQMERRSFDCYFCQAGPVAQVFDVDGSKSIVCRSVDLVRSDSCQYQCYESPHDC